MTEAHIHQPEHLKPNNEAFLTTPNDLKEWQTAVESMLHDAVEAEAAHEGRRKEAHDALARLEDEQDERQRAMWKHIDTRDQAADELITKMNHATSQADHDKLVEELDAVKKEIAQLEEQAAAIKGEDVRQDPSLDYLKVSHSDLERELYRRKRQAEGVHHNLIRLYEDEADLSRFDKFLKPATEVPENFALPASTIDRHMDPQQARALLDSLPCVSPDSLEQVDRKNPTVEILGGVPFPVDRIVGFVAADKWAGGANKEPAIGGYEHLYPEGISNTPIDKVIAYASRRVPADQITLRIIRDAAGEYWGFSVGDCSHRLAAAKLRGEKTVPLKAVLIESEDEMTTIPYSVRERFGKATI